MMNMMPSSSSSSSSANPPIRTSASPPWIELPDDLTANILQRLYTEEILKSAQLVCRTWWRICKNPTMWRVIDLDLRRHAMRSTVGKFNNICRFALDRSQGQLIELRIAASRVDGLLNYIADRSSQLRILQLGEYGRESNRDLILAIRRFPQLEELRVTQMPPLSIEDFESIGISCSGLKSFTYNDSSKSYEEFSEHAVAIGKTMPNLRHLRLCHLRMGNHALEAILDGCPHLESLELCQCPGLYLQGSLGKRCSDQIRDLKIQAPYNRDDDTESTDSDSTSSSSTIPPWIQSDSSMPSLKRSDSDSDSSVTSLMRS